MTVNLRFRVESEGVGSDHLLISASAHSRMEDFSKAELSFGFLTYLPHLKSRAKKFKQVASEQEFPGAENSFQVLRDSPAQS